MANYQYDMDHWFQPHPGDNTNQQQMKYQYCALLSNIDSNIPSHTLAGAEKSTAKRKLLESMDAALRALAT